MTPTFAALRAEYAALWRGMTIDQRRAPAILAAARRPLETIPPQYQLISALVIGVLVAIGAAYRFFADLRRPPPAVADREHLRIIGAALGDTATLTAIADELREIRGVMQRHLDTDRTDELVRAIERVADARPARRPLRARTPRH